MLNKQSGRAGAEQQSRRYSRWHRHRACARYGETVEAAVRVRAGSQLQAAELMSICERKLGKFKSPDRVHFLEELPKGPSGKIQRLKLALIIGDAPQEGVARAAPPA